MSWLEALILGIIQGLTEFLPVSSSGHLELGSIILDIDTSQNMMFAIVVHGATVLSILFVFWKDIRHIVTECCKFEWNESTKYMSNIIISMIPVGILGFFFQSEVESLFSGNAFLVGVMLVVTALLLTFTYLVSDHHKSIRGKDAFLMGIAQAFAVIPGISRSGATIATGLYLKNKRAEVTRFSFLMVLLPIIGANAKYFITGKIAISGDINIIPLTIGFISAFVSGLFACKWMIRIVNRGHLIYFAIYCGILGLSGMIFA